MNIPEQQPNPDKKDYTAMCVRENIEYDTAAIAPYVDALQKVMDIPYDRVDATEIRDYLMGSARWLQEQGKVFYMNSCVPRTLLLADALQEIAHTSDISFLVDVYQPIRDDYKQADGSYPTTIHVALEIHEGEHIYTIQFFNRAWHISAGAYINKEPHIQRLLPFLGRVPITEIDASMNIQDILEQLGKHQRAYTLLLEHMEKTLDSIVARLSQANTEEEYLQPHNQAFIQQTPVYCS